MEIEVIILNSEKEFRNYLILNSDCIQRVIAFEDALDHVIFFYCFFCNGLIVAAKEVSTKCFSVYQNDYNQLANKLHLHINSNYSKSTTIELIKN